MYGGASRRRASWRNRVWDVDREMLIFKNFYQDNEHIEFFAVFRVRRCVHQRVNALQRLIVIVAGLYGANVHHISRAFRWI